MSGKWPDNVIDLDEARFKRSLAWKFLSEPSSLGTPLGQTPWAGIVVDAAPKQTKVVFDRALDAYTRKGLFYDDSLFADYFQKEITLLRAQLGLPPLQERRRNPGLRVLRLEDVEGEGEDVGDEL